MPIEYLMWAPLVGTSLVLYATLAAGALFSIASSEWVSSSSRRLWAAAVILLPIAGAVSWLAASHRHNTTHHDDEENDMGPQPRARRAAPAKRMRSNGATLARRKPGKGTTGKRMTGKRMRGKGRNRALRNG